MGSELNIYKIAQEAGVSPATVSRVMTKNARVSEEKRARVEAVIRKYDYRPNALAQGLIKTKTNVIGVLAADLVNPYYSSMMENCEKEIIARVCADDLRNIKQSGSRGGIYPENV